MSGNRRDDGEESRRILDRIAKESDPSGSLAHRAARRVERHVRAEDADQTDAVEVWGTRIGRVIGLVMLVVLSAWLLNTIFGG